MGNNYNVPIQGSYSESTRTKLTPDVKFTSNELLQIINSQTSAKAIADKEAKDKATRLSKSESAYQKRIKTGIQSSQDLADETGAIGDKISLQNLPYVGKYIPDMLDATGMIGNMASGLGRVPLNLEQRNYGQAALSVATPLTVGALAGIGTQNTGQFVNNLANPLAGTGDLVNNLGNKYLPNAYKLNPNAFKPNPEAYYRIVGQDAVEDALQSKLIRNRPTNNLNQKGTIDLSNRPTAFPSFSKGKISTEYANGLSNHGLIETERLMKPSNMGRHGKGTTQFPIDVEGNYLNQFSIEEAKIYKKDWLQGYKQVEVPKTTQNFKSEIDWAKWNKEIPENTQLMQEYNTIEQKAKANNTWMKNPDGSKFQGTPEQFVQQNSENFKKAFPKGYDKVYRGGNNETLENRPHPIVFTGDKATAQYYTGSSDFANTVATPTQESGRVLFDLYHPKSNNSIVINNQGKSWREIPRKYFGDNPPLRDLHNSKGDFTSTDDIAKWIVENDKNSVRLNNIFDSYDADFVNIINHKPGNYLKSAVGNNGMFDMTNPNIYKTVVGALATGTLGKQAMEKKEFGGKILNTKIENGKKYFLINV